MSKSQEELLMEIKALAKKRKAMILAHNYQRDDIQELADLCGDSLGLSMQAAQTDAEVIVFCGVHFMAESASILSPGKTVLLPRFEAGCPMADMLDAESLRAKKQELPGVPVVTYINSTAEVKAFSDICCTSANAIKVVNSLEADRLLFTPDRNLGHYASLHTDKEVILWPGYCPTHHLLKIHEVLDKKAQYPEALFVAHPECKASILELADHICSTSGMYAFAKSSPAKQFIIGTEHGIIYRLKKENPEKEFIHASSNMICPNMKMIDLEDVLEAVDKMDCVVKVPEEIRVPAKQALDRMIAIPRDY